MLKFHARLSAASAVFAIVLSMAVVACTPAKQPEAATTATAQVNCAAANVAKGAFAPVPNVIDGTCAAMPVDFAGTPGQEPVDLYSWLSFLAVNWPANDATCTGNPQATMLSGPQNPTWMTYLSDDSVFVPKGSSPAPWCGGAAKTTGALQAKVSDEVSHLPPAVKKLAMAHPEAKLILFHNAKGHELLSTLKLLKSSAPESMAAILQATGQPLTDQNGRFVRYTISMNEDEYKYILANSLWTAKGQAATETISFPSSVHSSGAIGAMEVKGAWKVLGPGDDPTHFFTQTAIVYNTDTGQPSPGPNPVTVGLVGLHILHKTQNQPHWLWSTFEQVENDTKSFYNPNCSAADCPPNAETAKQPYTELDPKTGKPVNKPVQVVPVMQTTAAGLNSTFQGLLKGTPWGYYQLISTQWEGNLPPGPKPAVFGNTVLETFVQPDMYSCIKCHSFAKDLPAKKPSDLSFLLDAQQ